jgi:hypothetical protein
MRLRRLHLGLPFVCVVVWPSPAVSAQAAATCFGQTVTVSGSGTITGTPGNDVIDGSMGKDHIDAQPLVRSGLIIFLAHFGCDLRRSTPRALLSPSLRHAAGGRP